MCDIDINKWDNVIIEWANCLQISKSINAPSDLRNGDFFNKLLMLFGKTKANTSNTLESVYKFIKSKYANFLSIHSHKLLSNIPDNELIVVASLLMHYACIYDRRDELTSPLCNKLTQDVQLCMKKFLESMTSDITYNNLEKIIIECVSNANPTPGSYQWLSCGDSPLSHTSPLQDFLKTPISKSSRMHEKDKEIKKLKSELDMQKYEKEDLLDELKEHKDKIKKISKQVTEKTIEVSKLSSQLVALENRTPPHKPRALQEIERHLRAELHNAQQFISQLQEEIDELEDSKEEIHKKQKKIEEQSCLWQERAVTSESKYDVLTDAHKEQREELNNLRMNYNELSALLEELRTTNKANDSCNELDFSQAEMRSKSIDNISTTEEFACTVIEVQLRDVEKQNDDLTIALKSAVNKSVELESDLEHIKEDYIGLLNNFKSIQQSNEKFEEQVKELGETQMCMEKLNKELSENVDVLTNKNLLQRNELKLMQDSFEETKAILFERDTLLASLENDLKVIRNNYTDLEKLNEERSEQFDALQKEAKLSQTNYEESVQSYKKQDFELQSWTKLYAELEEKLEINLNKLVHLTYKGGHQVDYVYKFEDVLKQLEINLINSDEEKSLFCTKIIRYEEVVAAMQVEIEALKSNEETNSQKNKQLNENCDALKLLAQQLEFAIDDYKKKIDSLNSTINELNVTIEDLEKLKNVIEEQAHTIQVHENEEEKLKQEIHEQCEDVKRRILEENNLSEMVKELKAVKMNLNEELTNKNKELRAQLQLGDEYLEEINVLKSKNCDLCIKLNNSEKDIEEKKINLKQLNDSHLIEIKNWEEKHWNVNNKLSDADVLFANLKIKFEKDQHEMKEAYLEEIKKLESNNINLNNNLSNSEKNLQTEKHSLVNLKKEFEQTQLKLIEAHLEELKNVQNKNNVLNNKLLSAEEATKLQIIANAELKKTFDAHQLQLIEAHVQEIANWERKHAEINQEFKNSKETIEDQKLTYADLKKDFERKHNELCEAHMHDITNWEAKHKEATNKFKNSEETIKIQNETLIDFELKKIELIEANLQIINCEKQRVAIGSELRDAEATIEAQKISYANLKQEFERDQQQLHDEYLEKIRNCEAIQQQLNKKLIIAEDNIEAKNKLKQEYEETQLQLTEEYLEKIKKLEEIHNDLNCKLRKAEESFSAKNESHSKLKTDLELQNRTKLEEINRLNEIIASLETKTEHLEMDLKLAQDDSQIKSMQINDLANLKAQVESEFVKQMSELNKKIDLLEGTIHKLTLEREDINEKQDNCIKEIENHLKQNKELKNEKEDCLKSIEYLMGNVHELTQKLVAKEQMCEERDDVISQTNCELLQMKLNYENQKLEISAFKQKYDALDAINLENKQQILCLINEKDAFENEVDGLKNKIDILNELKAGLMHKTEDLEANASTIINQLAVKNEELFVAIENFKVFKEETSQEIEQLRLTLVEATHSLEQANEERVTLTSSKDKDIKELDNKAMFLTNELDVLKTKELGYLQEIGMIKDELTETINKYTDAIQMKDELRSENESQISRLTENIHELVEKYNKLDAKHEICLIELEKTKECLQEIDEIKQNYELKLVLQKNKYEEEFMAAADQYKCELESLRNTQNKLLDDIKMYTLELENGHANQSRLEIILERAESDLRVVGNEKLILLNKIEEVIKTNKDLELQYGNLKIENEDYCKESKLTLSKTQNKLEEAVESMQLAKNNSGEQIEALKQEIEDLKEELTNKRVIYEEALYNRDVEIDLLKNKITDIESNMAKLEAEKEFLHTQIIAHVQESVGLKLNCAENEAVLIQLETKINKLQCAYDILDTGKQKLELIHESLSSTHAELIASSEANDLRYGHETLDLNTKVHELEESMCEKVALLKENEFKMQKYNDEAKAIQKIVEAMKVERDDSDFDRNSLRTRLSIIEEDNDIKIKEEIAAFNTIKIKYDTLTLDKNIIEQHYEKLKDDLVKYSQEKKDIECIIKDKEASISNLLKELHEVNTCLDNKDSIIEALQKDLSCKMELVEALSSEKALLATNLRKTSDDLQKIKISRDDIMETHTKLLKDTENNLLRAHESAIDVKNELLSRVDCIENELKNERKLKKDIDDLLMQEKQAKEFLEIQVLELKHEQCKYTKVHKQLKLNIEKLCGLIYEKSLDSNEENNYEILNEIILDAEKRIIEIFAKKRELSELIENLEKDKVETITQIEDLQNTNESLSAEKIKLLENYQQLHLEKLNLTQEKDKESKCLDNLNTQYEILKTKYDALSQNETSFDVIKQKNTKNYQEYQDFVAHSNSIKKDIDHIISERNSLENIIGNLKDNYINLQIKTIHITEEENKLYYEQKRTLEIIFEDIQKQFNRLSKIVYNISLNTSQIFEKTVTGILTDKPVNWELLFKDLDIKETLIKLEDLTDNANNTFEQMQSYEKSIDALNVKQEVKVKVLKENVGALQKPKDDDWKKKYMAIKQRLTLIENAKNNYEKKLKQLRDEKKSLTAPQPAQAMQEINNDAHYKILLKQHIQAKEEHARIVNDYDMKYKSILREFEDYKLTNWNQAIKVDHEKELRIELTKLRDAYGNVMTDHNKLELENATLRKVLDDRNSQISGLHSIKEAYEKLFEENSKLMQEIDTLKYKRNRDREEYVRLLNKEKEDADGGKRMQEVRAEYEIKLEKMKDKMIQLYKEEVDKQTAKVASEKEENAFLMKTIDKQRYDLQKANQKIQSIERQVVAQEERTLHRNETDVYSSRESMVSRGSAHSRTTTSRDYADTRLNRQSTQSLGRDARRQFVEENRRFSTMPKNVANMDVIEEVRIRRRTSINTPTVHTDIGNGMEMEDEGDLFNNKYLTDLKEGKCAVNAITGRESNASRMSELAYRNSMCPPHLKSSYPAETQFTSPTHFQDNDIKTGNIDFDDSMSTRLLPGEKRKKDAGTTSYKRPGPPTPSKNAGRASLQGNEIHPREALRENVEIKTPKRSTPNRLKALFSRSSVKDTSENQPVSPKGKRLSIFRKPR